eukprot:1230759-Alexandrium_andersonii.AAC.1
MVARVSSLLLFCARKHIQWCLERPASSLMDEHPRMREVFEKIKRWAQFTWMAEFGAETRKARRAA